MGVECNPRLSCRGSSVTPPPRPDGLLFYCSTTIASTAPSSPRRTRCPTHLSLPRMQNIERNTLTKERIRQSRPDFGLGWSMFSGKGCQHHPDEQVGVVGLLHRPMWALHSPNHGQARIQPVIKRFVLVTRQGIERSTLAVEIQEDSVNEKVTARCGQNLGKSNQAHSSFPLLARQGIERSTLGVEVEEDSVSHSLSRRESNATPSPRSA